MWRVQYTQQGLKKIEGGIITEYPVQYILYCRT